MPKHIYFTFIILLFWLFASQRVSAEIRDSTFRYEGEVNVSFSSGEHTPFWLANNRFGLGSIEKNNGYVRAGLFKNSSQKKKKFDWGAGVDFAATWNYSSPFVVQQLYGELTYWNGKLTVGSKEFTEGITDERLSSGDLLFSTNAKPIPQARLEVPEYIAIPGLKQWVSFRGHIAFGMFTDDGWQKDFVSDKSKRTEDVLFHSKAGFLKFGNEDKFPLVVEAGMEMAAQFGGKSISAEGVINQPTSIKDWWHIIIPSGGGSNTPMGEQLNVYGNHVGEWVFSLSYLPKSTNLSAKVYFEHYFEDHSMMFFDFLWKDMLLGVEVSLPQNPILKGFVYEYLYSKDQASSVYWDHTPEIPEQVSGRDQYYNHYIYTGWQHWGMGIGNPLLISPIYNSDGWLGFLHNRIVGHHLGIVGSPHRWFDYRVLLSYTRSWGTYDIPTKRVLSNFNTLFEATVHPPKLRGWQGTFSLATDGGSLLGRSFGVMFSIKKTGWL